MALVMAGAGTQILSGANTYSGSTSVTSGVLEAATTAALPGYPNYHAPDTVTVAAGAVLAVQLGNGATGWSSTQIGSLLGGVAWSNSTAASASIRPAAMPRTAETSRHAGGAHQAGGQHPDPDRRQQLYRPDQCDVPACWSLAGTASLPGYSTPNTVSVAAGAALGVQPWNGTTGWNTTQIGALVTTPVGPPARPRHRYDQRQFHLRRQRHHDQRQYRGPYSAIGDGAGQAGGQHPDPDRRTTPTRAPRPCLPACFSPPLAASLPFVRRPVTVAGGAGLTVPTGDGSPPVGAPPRLGSLLASVNWGNGTTDPANLGIDTTNASLTYGGAIGGSWG